MSSLQITENLEHPVITTHVEPVEIGFAKFPN